MLPVYYFLFHSPSVKFAPHSRTDECRYYVLDFSSGKAVHWFAEKFEAVVCFCHQ